MHSLLPSAFPQHGSVQCQRLNSESHTSTTAHTCLFAYTYGEIKPDEAVDATVKLKKQR